MKHVFVVVLVGLTVALVPAAASGSAPPGATAQCNDGTYSYSQHHSGTCSHHGGVAVWIGGSTAATSSAATSTTSNSTSASSTPVNLGTTVLLKARTKTSGCTLGAEPDRRCSPGAYYSGLTKTVICSASFRTGTVRNVPESEKHQVEVEYGMAPRSYGSTLEIDHIVSLELGGSNDIANLYPEEATLPSHRPGYHIKDKLENAAHDWVCAGKITLRTAQQKIATDWEALYKLVFGTVPTG